jgi:hypothetical protein
MQQGSVMIFLAFTLRLGGLAREEDSKSENQISRQAAKHAKIRKDFFL